MRRLGLGQPPEAIAHSLEPQRQQPVAAAAAADENDAAAATHRHGITTATAEWFVALAGVAASHNDNCAEIIDLAREVAETLPVPDVVARQQPGKDY